MKLFNKPGWLKPEVNEPMYWLHLLIVSAVAISLLSVWNNELLTIKNIFSLVPFIFIGDVIAHTILKFD